MPIDVAARIEACDQETFHTSERRIMRIAFDVHNEFGRLFDEELYKSEIAARCASEGIQPVEREVKIRVSHQGFAKDYFIDLLFCRGWMFEGKAAERFVAAHRGQALHYLLLAGLKHGCLVNFRAERVQREFISTTLSAEERRRFAVVDRDWEDMNAESRQLKLKAIELMEDWGAFLDVSLYREALVHFLGGPLVVFQPVPIFSGPRQVGVQRINLLNEQTGFAVTSTPRAVAPMRDHFERLLYHAQLQAMQWINLNRHLIEFVTLTKSPNDRIMIGQNDRDAAGLYK